MTKKKDDTIAAAAVETSAEAVETKPTEQGAEQPAEPPKNPLEREVILHISAQVVDAQVDKLLDMRGKNVSMAGFRPGKVPKSVLHRNYGKAALGDVLNDEGGKALQQHVEQSGEYPAAQPHVHPSLVAGEQGYEIKCHYEVLPNIEEPDFSEKKLTVPSLSITDKEVGEMIEILREQRGDLTAKQGDTASDDTDFVVFDFTTKLKDKDEIIEQGEDRRLRLNAPNLLPEITKTLSTAKKGDTFKVDIKLPNHHPKKELQSQEAVMDITVKAIEVLDKPALDEKFYSEFGVEDGDAESFRNMVKEHLDREVAMRLQQVTKRAALNKLLESTPPFPLPMSMWVSEVRNLQQQYAQSGETSPPNMDALMAEAQQRVMLGLVLSAWKKRSGVQVASEEVDMQIDEMIALHEDEEQSRAQIRGNEKQMEMVHLAVIENKVCQWVKDNVELTEEPIALQTLLEQAV